MKRIYKYISLLLLKEAKWWYDTANRVHKIIAGTFKNANTQYNIIAVVSMTYRAVSTYYPHSCMYV